MCGIIGYTGNEQVTPILLDGLKRLEYRGYDSAGVAVMGADDRIQIAKAKGRLQVLSDQLDGGAKIGGTVGIGHTRWATHGKPSDENSHPHTSESGRFAIVHNGIIENYQYLRKFLTDKGVRFTSETDTETVAHLLDYYYKGDIMDTMPICVNTMDDKEDVAKKMKQYDFVTMPVVDDEIRLVGIVTFDDAMDVMQEETTEDLEMMAAMAHSDDGYFKTSDFVHAKNRIVWLLILMLSAAVTGSVINSYEAAFNAIPALVAFIPMLMGTGGNCGAQSSTMIIRGMSIDEIQLRDFPKVLWLEFRVSIILSTVLAIVNGLKICIFDRDVKLALVVSLAVAGTVIMAEVIGCILPMLAKKCKVDPAVMASPIITTIVDAGSILIYFGIASRFFNL